jgi:putative protein kinase ArgK-like GTPase of G3E family
MKINLINCSNLLNSKDARLVATTALKLLLRNHRRYADHTETVKMSANDYVDLMAIAHLVEDYDTEYNDMNEKERKKRCDKIGKAIWEIDTDVREQIPARIYNRFVH